MIDIIIIINSSSLLMKSNRGQNVRLVVSFCRFFVSVFLSVTS